MGDLMKWCYEQEVEAENERDKQKMIKLANDKGHVLYDRLKNLFDKLKDCHLPEHVFNDINVLRDWLK